MFRFTHIVVSSLLSPWLMAGVTMAEDGAGQSVVTPNKTISTHDVIRVRLAHDPLPSRDALTGGAHPVGGPSMIFVDLANDHSHLTGIEFAVDQRFGADAPASLHGAVALSSAKGGFDAGIGLAIANGHPFGELLVAGLPFGMSPDEFMAYLYEGGGLELQQQLYDEALEKSLVVIPVAITGGQGAGWFPRPLPDPGNVWQGEYLSPFDPPSENDRAAMREKCCADESRCQNERTGRSA